MASVIVTGAAGHVGANLVRALLAQGHRVRALIHRDRRALEGLDVETTRGDVGDLDSLLRAFAGAELVYHTACYISLSGDEQARLEAVNVLGTHNVVEACLQCGVQRLVHFSSIETLLGAPLGSVVDESRSAVSSRHHTPYAQSKVAGEQEVIQGLARGLDAIRLYPSAIIGPYDYRLGFPNAGILAVLNGELRALVRGGFDWVDVRDLVGGALLAAGRAASGERYILSGHWASLSELAEMAEEISGAHPPRLVFPMWLARVGAPFAVALGRLNGGRPLYTPAALKPLRGNHRISHEHATRDLGYYPRALRETLVDTWRWFENNRAPSPLASDKGTEGP